MSTDYPDGTFPVALIMADIMMPVDIQAQYVTLDVDITAQSIGNLTIDIAAQSIGNLNVNIAASAITINVAVTGTANINITAQSVGVYLMPDWSTKEGNDIGWLYNANQKGFGEYAAGSYLVPAGKTLYITAIQASCIAFNGADGDKPQHFWATVYNGADTFDMVFGGDGGACPNLSRPLRVDAEDTAYFKITCMANHDCSLDISWQGYLI